MIGASRTGAKQQEGILEVAKSVSPDHSEGNKLSMPEDIIVDIEASPDDLLSDCTDYDYALYRVLDGGVDYFAQISAVRDLLHRQQKADVSLWDEMTKIEAFIKNATGNTVDRAIDEWGEHFNASVYQDAAHSMAAVGMLAPLIESMFDQSFAGIRKLFETSRVAINSSHPRWGQQSTKKKWDYHFSLDGTKLKKGGLAKGILELVDTVGLSAHMPNDLKPVLQALFEYRNKMFHCGFEWPPVERKRFEEKRADWPSDWFSKSTSGDEPWIFYLSEAFTEHCLEIIHSVLSGIGAFARIRGS